MDTLPNRDVYFGVGCYWHVMHEFVQTEQNVLGRSTKEVTSAAGYGGSKLVGKDSNRPDNKKGVVCYHNLMGVGDYGSLGYGEVVGMDLPKTEESMRAFAKEYFSLFKNGDRPDLGDRGLEYRSLIGLPSGVEEPSFQCSRGGGHKCWSKACGREGRRQRHFRKKDSVDL